MLFWPDGRHTITFNGENPYNFLETSASFEPPACASRTQVVPDFVLGRPGRHGMRECCCASINGTWALAIFRHTTKICSSSRRQVRQSSPLALHSVPDPLRFASEQRALVSVCLAEPSLDIDVALAADSRCVLRRGVRPAPPPEIRRGRPAIAPAREAGLIIRAGGARSDHAAAASKDLAPLTRRTFWRIGLSSGCPSHPNSARRSDRNLPCTGGFDSSRDLRYCGRMSGRDGTRATNAGWRPLRRGFPVGIERRTPMAEEPLHGPSSRPTFWRYRQP